MRSEALKFPPILERVAAALPSDIAVYLVGGAVRDALLGRVIHDLDFILPVEVLKTARRLADSLGAAFYPLDAERDAARLIYNEPDGGRLMLDFTLQQGSDLESDLRARDFTINAMAVDARKPQTLIDPLRGAADLFAKKLRTCSPRAFQDDPVRVLRAVRQAVEFDLLITPQSLSALREATPNLPAVSSERLRDELFRILSGKKPATALRTLDILGTIPYILPELAPLKNLQQPPPHIFEAWEHTLEVIDRLKAILDALSPSYDPDKASSLMLGLTVLHLGRFRKALNEHLNIQLNPNRSPRALLFLAALYHDTGKPQTRQVTEEGRIRFLKHDEVGRELVLKRAQSLHLSNNEVERLKTIVRHHMRPLLLAKADHMPNRRAIYRFFRATGPAGIDICILSLADTLGTYGTTLPQDIWIRQLDVIRVLLEAWWEKPEESIAPAALLNGHDLIEKFGLQPGPKVGYLLEAIREAQATDEVHDLQEAYNLAQSLIQAQ